MPPYAITHLELTLWLLESTSQLNAITQSTPPRGMKMYTELSGHNSQEPFIKTYVVLFSIYGMQ